MKIIIEDYNGNDLCSFDVYENKFEPRLPITHTIKRFVDCNVADVDEDENGIKQVRIQLEEEK